MRSRLAQARVARLATLTADGRPHLVPVCFALTTTEIVSAVDAKPKTTTGLRRLANVRAHPVASVLVDHYEDDWDQVWWVRVDGQARVVEACDDHEGALAALAEKYPQYRRVRPTGAVLAITPVRWRGWAASA
jgi:PPOX class probable F420-dependent enzyme